ncbi:protein bicaudal C homolog 1 isoform X2 [Maniola jurtina]|uniref:protein bicaudal C homolog 1 isoform X2 n=1 Tax=Maniola jurtina TaxID=191418 RepID=UPI001E68A797|nr:protein bicaudal C homolog 1 isoform X2 [Maniola jurtina]
MASTNFLTAKSRLSEFKNSSDKDTISEASESGTSNSVTSAEDLQKLAVILGLNSVEDVYQERFRVDRRRLEAMLAENLEESQTAQAFFHRVMNETNTLINWPARLKIGARSKKDPHVRIAGRPDDVRLAREKIMQLLDTRSNRVTMKIDVSYTDHSHIIGKGGQTIKRVMEETGCHIHFPDSNRTSAQEKSNQVSIAGEMDRVERARARVRALTPLVFCFELPITTQSQPDINAPYVQQIQEQYKVQVMLRNRPKLHANLLVVKGVQWEVNATMEATTLLMNYMCGQLASQTKVQTTLEISPMHHPVVIGRGAEQLKLIMNGTHTQIMFPDAEDPNIPTLRKSCVTITGQINDVYNARQQLVGSLPLVVIFDVPEASFRADANETERLMSQHNVLITVRPKPKQGITSVVIKGIERCAGKAYPILALQASCRADGDETERLMSQHNVLITVRPKPKQGITSVVIKGIERCAGKAYPILALQASCRADGDETERLMSQHNVLITVRPKPKQGITSVVIKGIERCAGKAYPILALQASCCADGDETERLMSQHNVLITVRPKPKQGITSVVIKGIERCAGKAYPILALQASCRADGDETERLMSQHNVLITVRPKPKQGITSVVIKGIERCAGKAYPILALQASCRADGDETERLMSQHNVLITVRPKPKQGITSVVIKGIERCAGKAYPILALQASCRADGDETERLMSQHNVLITVRPKPKQGITSVVIKGIERCAGDIYEVRRELLGGSEPSVTVEIPESYNIPAGTRAMPNFSPFNPFSPTPVPVNTSPRSQYNLQLLTDLANYNLGSPMYGHGPPTPGGYPAPISPLTMTPPIFPGWIIPSPQPRPGAFHFPGMAANPGPNMYKTQASWNQMSGTADVTSCAQMPHDQRHMSSSSQASSSGYQSNFTGSSISLDTQNISGNASNVGSPSVSPISNHVSIHSPTASTSNSSTSTDADRTQQDLANIISELPISDRRAVGCEKKTLETLKISPPSEYRKLQAEASKAMQESVGGGYRVPNNRWSGYFFSQTSPGPLNLQENGGMTTPERGWNRSELSRPNIMVTSPPQRASPSTSSHSHTPSPAQSHTPSPAQSHTQSPAQSHTQSPAQSHTQSPAQSLMPSPPKRKPCTYQMLYDLLRDRGLYKYIELFKRHELDLPTFASLNEGDLIEIGVSAFGARKKMLSIMAELRKQPRTFDAPAAPTEVRLLNSPTQYNTAARTQDNW